MPHYDDQHYYSSASDHKDSHAYTSSPDRRWEASYSASSSDAYSHTPRRSSRESKQAVSRGRLPPLPFYCSPPSSSP